MSGVSLSGSHRSFLSRRLGNSLSPCPLVPLSPCPLVPLSPCPLVPLSPCLPFTLPRHPAVRFLHPASARSPTRDVRASPPLRRCSARDFPGPAGPFRERPLTPARPPRNCDAG